MFLPHPRVKVSIAGSLRDREVACSASDRQGSNFESCVWRTVSSQSSHPPQEVLLAQFSLYVHKGGLKPDSFHLFRPLTITVNQSLTTGIFPQKIKIAKVSPLYKNSDATIFKNYRPISLLTVISKIFEKVIFQQINKYFTENKLFNISQYGFRKNHSPELAALELIDRLTTYMNNGDILITIFLDLSKALIH